MSPDEDEGSAGTVVACIGEEEEADERVDMEPNNDGVAFFAGMLCVRVCVCVAPTCKKERRARLKGKASRGVQR